MDFMHAWEGKRVLVTGGSGFIGRYVLQLGLQAGVELHNLSLRKTSFDGIRQHCLTLCDQKGHLDLIERIQPQGIIHLAAVGVAYQSVTLSEMILINAVGTANLLEAVAITEQRPPVVIAGSGAEYKPQDRRIAENDPVAPISAYGVSKAAATLCARLYATKMPITLLRLFNVYGPGEPEARLAPSIITAAKKGVPIALTNCEQLRDYTYVEDVAESFWRALSGPSQDGELRVFNVGTGRAITLRHFVLALSEILQERGFHPRLLFGAKPYRLDEPIVYTPDVTQIKNAFSWVPPTTIIEGLLQTVEQSCD